MFYYALNYSALFPVMSGEMVHIRNCFIFNIHKITIAFVECDSGTFGNSCSSNCHCINETCNPINGTCPDGECKPGYKDHTCSTGMWYGDWL